MLGSLRLAAALALDTSPISDFDGLFFFVESRSRLPEYILYMSFFKMDVDWVRRDCLTVCGM
jgi:hypothetical protein